jgi:hypothetical protein
MAVSGGRFLPGLDNDLRSKRLQTATGQVRDREALQVIVGPVAPASKAGQIAFNPRGSNARASSHTGALIDVMAAAPPPEFKLGIDSGRWSRLFRVR